MKRFILFFFLIPISFGQIFAQSTQDKCSDVDIREQNPILKSLFSSPRYQGEFGWCYAYAAADLLSAEVGVLVSGVHTSAIYNKFVASNFFRKILMRINSSKKKSFHEIYEGGIMASALKFLKAEGSVCSDKSSPLNEDLEAHLLYSIEMIENLRKMNKINENFGAESICLEAQLVIKDQHFLFSNFQDVFEMLIAENLNSAFEKSILNNCKSDRILVPDYEVNSIPKITSHEVDREFDSIESNKEIFFEKIGRVLQNGRPLAISYNTKWIKTTHEGFQHGSVVIARRWHNNKCEYKIRNSWGKDCSSYASNIECNQEEGSFWVNEDTFYKMTSSLDYLTR